MPHTRRTPRVLIAEDDDDMRFALCELVSRLSVEVASASTGGELILLLTDDRPVDLLIADADLPWMNGLQVALAARNSGMTMPVIIVDTYYSKGIQSKVDQLGAADLFTMPSSPEDLLSLIRGRLAIATTGAATAVA
jgi:CheY-like chemotaxis protein